MIAFFGAFLLGFFIFGLECFQLWKRTLSGRALSRSDHVACRIKHMIRFSFGQSRVRERWWGWAHVAVFYAFLVFLCGTIELLVQDVFAGWKAVDLFSQNFVSAVHLIQTGFAWLTIAAVSVLAARRLLCSKKIRSTFDAWLILSLIALLMVSHLGVMASNIALGDETDWLGRVLLFCSWIAHFCSQNDAQILHNVCSAIHVLCVSAFLVWIPRGKHLHIFTAFPNLFRQYGRYDETGHPVCAPETPDLQALEARLEQAVENDLPEDLWPMPGASKVHDLPRHFLLNAMTCTQCQRCTNACPLTASGLGNGPMQALIALRTLCSNSEAQLISDSEHTGIISTDELWACTQCGTCDRVCPIGNENAHRIIELRRGCVGRETHPSKLNALFAAVERSGNPWGYAKSDRNLWQKDIDFCQISERKNSNLPRVLVFAGCMASYDQKIRHTLQNVVRWLLEQGFEVRVPEREMCCGDALRRLGNESGFQACRDANLAEIEKIPHDIILTLCPHCAETLRYDYEASGTTDENGNVTEKHHLNAVHFAVFVSELLASGQICLNASKLNDRHKKSRFHTPCRLGKCVDSPQKLLDLVRALDMECPDGDVSVSPCCGGGGGQLFMDNSRNISKLRLETLADENTQEIVTACPFCIQMIGAELPQNVAIRNLADDIVLECNVATSL